MKKIKPLPGMSLIELDVPDKVSAGGIDIPDHTLSAEEHQQRSHNPEQPPGLTGVVVAIGEWPKNKKGQLLMPQFGIGARIVIRPTAGQEMHYGSTSRLRTIWNDDALAVIS